MFVTLIGVVKMFCACVGSPCIVGWKKGCRPLIGLDGTFLKGSANGVVLTVVGRDADDALYPIAFALVQKENQEEWTWFVLNLRVSLTLESGSTVTLMSDMQKV